MKVCSCCHKEKPLSEYSIFRKPRKDGSIREYPRPECKKCFAAKKREWDKAKRPSVRRLFGSAESIVERVLDAAMINRVFVFRGREGVAMMPANQELPPRAELIGTYDAGADYRLVLEDIAA